eukprot:3680000-Rhodomonas_salina.1
MPKAGPRHMLVTSTGLQNQTTGEHNLHKICARTASCSGEQKDTCRGPRWALAADACRVAWLCACSKGG